MLSFMPPALKLSYYVLTELYPWAGVVSQLVNQVVSVLLICCFQVLLLVCARRVSADYLRHLILFADEPHICPPSQA